MSDQGYRLCFCFFIFDLDAFWRCQRRLKLKIEKKTKNLAKKWFEKNFYVFWNFPQIALNLPGKILKIEKSKKIQKNKKCSILMKNSKMRFKSARTVPKPIYLPFLKKKCNRPIHFSAVVKMCADTLQMRHLWKTKSQ